MGDSLWTLQVTLPISSNQDQYKNINFNFTLDFEYNEKRFTLKKAGRQVKEEKCNIILILLATQRAEVESYSNLHDASIWWNIKSCPQPEQIKLLLTQFPECILLAFDHGSECPPPPKEQPAEPGQSLPAPGVPSAYHVTL